MTRILLVDDDESLRSLLRATLPRDGFEVVEAADGPQAIEAASKSKPDLVVLDWVMPEQTGDEVLAELKRVCPEVPVIVLTAEREPRYRELAESLGAAGFLTKPFSPLQLLGQIERLLTERALDQPS